MNVKELMQLDIPVAAAVIRYGSDWSVESSNIEFEQLFGGRRREPKDLVAGQDLCILEETMEEAVRMRRVQAQEVRIVRADGEVRWTQMRCSLLTHVDVTPYLFLAFWDIHERKLAELQHELLNRKYEMMESLSHEFPFDLDVENWVMLRSHRLMELRGGCNAKDAYYPVEEEIRLLNPLDQEPFLRAMQCAARAEMSGSIDVRFRVQEGEAPEYLWFRTFYQSVADGEGRVARIIGRSFNIDSDKRLQEEVRRDPLTKLLNKIEVQRELTAYLREKPAGTHAVLLIDIDNFKGINDTFGHTFGDTVITDVAKIIREQFRADDIVGRVGGDEFLAFMKDTSQKRAVEKAAHLCSVVSKDYEGGGVKYHISISVGVAMYAIDGGTYSALFEKADHAMYRAKQSGKNTYELAAASDVGPVCGRARAIERQELMSREDREFLAFATSLMAHARNLDGSLNMLLKRIAERYHLEMVAVLEHNDSRTESVMTNYYSNVFSFYDKSTILLQKDSVTELLLPGDYAVYRSSQLAGYRVGIKGLKTVQKLDPERPFSLVFVRFEYVAQRTGQMIYLSLDEERDWQQNELEMLQELTRTIAVFVSLRYRMDESRAQIRHIQKRDQLTDLYNQEAFKEKSIRQLREAGEGQVYAFEYLDIDNFGYVNENYGYKVGDNILRMLAANVSAQSYFVLGSRLYSDFFLLLLKAESRQELGEHIKSRNRRFLDMLSHQYPNSGMGITAGVYIVEDPWRVDVDMAIENANLAWKHAKNNGGRGAVFFENSFRTMRGKEQQVVGKFFEALYRGDFKLYLQPKFILGERTICGAEALSRWKRSEEEILSPASYIDSLERIGYITELDFYIFEELLRAMERWGREEKHMLVVSTNFSGRHFYGDGREFLDRVAHIMSKYDVSPAWLEIEVTESVLIKNLETLQFCIARLHEMGFRVAIDDFGTGYSSLSVLADVPADVVKIDRNFINRDMTDRRLILLNEIGRMVKILGKDIIIEGVETIEQERLLKNGGFVCGQGYLFSRALSAEEFEKRYLHLKKYKNDAAKS